MSDSILNLVRDNIRKLKAYSSARSLGWEGVFLDADENPFSENGGYCRYPEPQPKALVEALSSLYQVRPAQLLLGRGSDEGIDVLLRAFCEPKTDAILINTPTYGMYEVSANIQDVDVVRVPLTPDDFQLDLDAIMQTVTSQVKCVFICTPNNPTGNLLDRPVIQTLCESLLGRALVVVDEAYIEFSEQMSMALLLDRFENLVVLRTLSKAYGLAGLRCGAVLANRVVIDILKRVIAPYPIPVSIVPQILSNLKCEVGEVLVQRQWIYEKLQEFPFVDQVYQSDANFCLLKVSDASCLVRFCRERGLIIRDRSADLANCVRISVGTVEQNQLLMEVLNEYVA